MLAGAPGCRDHVDEVSNAAASSARESDDSARASLERARATFGASGWLTPARALAESDTNEPVRVDDLEATLPHKLDAAMVITRGAMELRARPLDVASSAAAIVDGVTVFREANVFRTVAAHGVDDLFALGEPRDAFEVRYEATLRGVAGLRLVDGTLELLDASGTPRMHIPAPIALAADGARRRGAIDVEGCAVDRDARGPWGRAVVAPGSERCTIVARVPTQGLAFPVLIDPAFESTGGLKYTHFKHAAVLLTAGADAGKVLIVGGGGAYTASVELYDPVTRTFATATALPTGSDLAEGTRAVELPDGTVMVAGGVASPTSATAQKTVLLRNPTTGAWTAAKEMAFARAHHAMAVVTIGDKPRVMVAGGQTTATSSSTAPPIASAELYAPESNTWTTIGFLKVGRSQMGQVVLPDGRLAVIGGDTLVSSSIKQLDTTEIYDASLDGWISGPKMSTTRTGMAVASLGGSKVVVAGGYGVPSGSYSAVLLDTIEQLDFATNTATVLPLKLTSARRDMATARLKDGSVMFAGGSTSTTLTTPTPSTLVDLFVPGAAPKLVSAASMREPRVFHAVTLLPSGNALVTGGWVGASAGFQSKSAEVFDVELGRACTATTDCPSGRTCVDGVCCASAACGAGEVCNAPGREGLCVKGKGATCASSSECATGFCVDGVCCAEACTGLCRSCALPGSEGTCTIAAAGTDPRLSCRGSSDPTCSKQCDGTGKCTTSYAPAGTPCGASLAGDAGLPFCSAYTCTTSGSCTLGTNKCGLTCVTSSTCNETTMSCTVTGAVTAGNCLIDSKCYKGGETKPGDSCSICDPGSTNTAWTHSLGCEPMPIDAGADSAMEAAVDSAVVDTGSAIDSAVEDTFVAEDSAAIDTSVPSDTGAAAPPPPADLPAASTCTYRASGSSSGNAGLALLGLFGAVLGLRRARRFAAATVVASAVGCSASAGRDELPAQLVDSGVDATPVDSDPGFDVGEMDVSLDENLGDAACAGKEVAAVKPEVDIIVVVDQSGSMSDEIAQVKSNINKLSEQLNKAYLDYRVVVIAKMGTSTYNVCVPPPLGGPDCKSNPPIFRASNQEVQSTDALQRILETYDSVLPSLGWRDMLRENSTKVFVPITDDNATTPKAVAPLATVAQQFDAELLKRSTKFGTEAKRKYRFYPICGAAAGDEFTKCGTGMVNTGPTYIELVKLAGGKWYPLCAPDYGPMFIDMAKTLAGEVACELAIPPPPTGETLDPNKINVIYTSSDGSKTEVVPQDTSAACDAGANGWQYNEDKTKVRLCGEACTRVREDLGAKVKIQFGCRTKID